MRRLNPPGADRRASTAAVRRPARLLLFAALLVPAAAGAGSVCYGTPGHGRLEQGRALPAAGRNFEAYSRLGVLLGRTYVHDRVHDVLLDAYAALERKAPGQRFVYGETGLAAGGRFAPHKTHQNGLSVDFFVPVVDRAGRPASLPLGAGTRFGYDLEFDATGALGDLRIDFEAMARHLLALRQAADRRGVGIRVVIFDNALQRRLREAPSGAEAFGRLTFSTRKPWVRHDEHYHVDFDLPCRPER